MKFSFPSTVGPEVLLPCALFAFMCGYHLPMESGFTMEVSITIALLVSLFVVQHRRIYSVILMLTFTALGVLASNPVANLTKAKHTAYIRWNKVQQKGKVFKAVGQLYERKGLDLIPTGEELFCTILPKNSIPTEGAVALVPVQIIPIEHDKNPGAFDKVTYNKSKGITHECFITDSIKVVAQQQALLAPLHLLRGQISEIFRKQLSNEEFGLAKALLLGDASEVDPTSKADFSATGAIHVLAVSGMHVSLFAQMLWLFFGLFHRVFSKITVQIVCIAILWAYAVLTGLSPSVVRSVLMFTVLQLGQMAGKPSEQNHLLFLCAFLMLATDPDCAMDIGFQLSFLAVFGIVNFQKPIEAWIKIKPKWLCFIWKNTSVALAAQALTLPLTFYYFHAFPNYFLLANLGVVVLSGVAMYLGFCYLFLCAIPIVGDFFAFPFQYALKALNGFLHAIANLPGAVEKGFVLSSTTAVGLLCSILFFFWIRWHWSLRVLPLTLILVLITRNRFLHQHENHLFLLKSKTPVFIFKQQRNATLIVPRTKEKLEAKALGLLCANYNSIYPYQKLDTVYLEGERELVMGGIKFNYTDHKIDISKNSMRYSINFEKEFPWKIVHPKGNTLPFQAQKLAF